MYLLNVLDLQAAYFIAISRFRTGQLLVGVIDGTRVSFFLPGSDKFVHDLPHLTVSVYLNGMRQLMGQDYTISESGGVGSGYDTVTFIEAPRSGDVLLVDYVTPSA